LPTPRGYAVVFHLGAGPVFEKLNEALGNVRVFATDEMTRKALRGIEEDDDEVGSWPAPTL